MATKQHKFTRKRRVCRNQTQGGETWEAATGLRIDLQRFSLQLEQLHVKNKGGVRRDDPGMAGGAVRHVRCAGDFSSLAEAHLRPQKHRS